MQQLRPIRWKLAQAHLMMLLHPECSITRALTMQSSTQYAIVNVNFSAASFDVLFYMIWWRESQYTDFTPNNSATDQAKFTIGKNIDKTQSEIIETDFLSKCKHIWTKYSFALILTMFASFLFNLQKIFHRPITNNSWFIFMALANECWNISRWVVFLEIISVNDYLNSWCAVCTLVRWAICMI